MLLGKTFQDLSASQERQRGPIKVEEEFDGVISS